MARVIDHLYEIGVAPDLWKLEAQPDADAWTRIASVIEKRDPLCRGILLLGLDAPEAELAAAFKLAAGQKYVSGFAIGRTIFAAPARDWFAGHNDDETATARMAASFGRLVALWEKSAMEQRS